MKTTRCPLCASDVIIEDEAYEGDLVDCANCGAELEISSLHPLRLAKSGAEEIPLAGEAEISRD
ncbi:MAG: lysine biosynthesis protein LysW [Planctomycetes bacterium]|nr:lysine biosynthesis protein LysW [Planctomycetota bacterium]